MKLEEACEVLEDLLTNLHQWPPEDRIDAIRLGVLALERILYQRNYRIVNFWGKLPGETE